MSETFENCTYQRTITETVKAVVVTEDNIAPLAQHIAGMKKVSLAEVKYSAGSAPKLIVQSAVRGQEAWGIGCLIDISGDVPRSAYERRDISEWLPVDKP
jgi:hypothetical protein